MLLPRLARNDDRSSKLSVRLALEGSVSALPPRRCLCKGSGRESLPSACAGPRGLSRCPAPLSGLLAKVASSHGRLLAFEKFCDSVGKPATVAGWSAFLLECFSFCFCPSPSLPLLSLSHTHTLSLFLSLFLSLHRILSPSALQVISFLARLIRKTHGEKEGGVWGGIK